MNIKRMLGLLLVVTFVLQGSVLSFAQKVEAESASDTKIREESTPVVSDEDFCEEPKAEYEEIVLNLKNPCEADEDGNVPIPEKMYMDFIFPEQIRGEAVTSIGPNAFKGCDLFQTVVLHSGIEEIGEDAFADCSNLKYIILLDRADFSDLTVGDNWSGDAEVVFGLVPVEAEEEEQAEESAEPQETEQEQSDTTEEEPRVEDNTTEEEVPVKEDSALSEEGSEEDASAETPNDTMQKVEPAIKEDSEDEEEELIESIIPSEPSEQTEDPVDDASEVPSESAAAIDE